MKVFRRILIGLCALALASAGPLGPAFSHAAAHALRPAHRHADDGHAQGPEGHAHHQEMLQAAAMPAHAVSEPRLIPSTWARLPAAASLKPRRRGPAPRRGGDPPDGDPPAGLRAVPLTALCFGNKAPPRA